MVLKICINDENLVGQMYGQSKNEINVVKGKCDRIEATKRLKCHEVQLF